MSSERNRNQWCEFYVPWPDRTTADNDAVGREGGRHWPTVRRPTVGADWTTPETRHVNMVMLLVLVELCLPLPTVWLALARTRICRQNNKQFARSWTNKGPQRIRWGRRSGRWRKHKLKQKNSGFSCTYESESEFEFPLDTDFEQPLLCAGFNRELARERKKLREEIEGEQWGCRVGGTFKRTEWNTKGNSEGVLQESYLSDSKRSASSRRQRELFERERREHWAGTKRGSTGCSKRVLSSSEKAAPSWTFANSIAQWVENAANCLQICWAELASNIIIMVGYQASVSIVKQFQKTSCSRIVATELSEKLKPATNGSISRHD